MLPEEVEWCRCWVHKSEAAAHLAPTSGTSLAPVCRGWRICPQAPSARQHEVSACYLAVSAGLARPWRYIKYTVGLPACREKCD